MPVPRRTAPDSWTTRLAHSHGVTEPVMWRRLREELGLSLRDVAKAVGVSHEAVSKWEHGRNYPDPDSHTRLLEVLAAGRPAKTTTSP